MKVKKTDEFEEWFLKETAKSQVQIAARIDRINLYNHFGDSKQLGADLAELRWKNGRRIYFTIYEEKGKVVLLLLGGYKNDQAKDIKKCRYLIKRLSS